MNEPSGRAFSLILVGVFMTVWTIIFGIIVYPLVFR